MKVHPISHKELWLAEGALFGAILLQIITWAIAPDLAHGPQFLIITTEVALAVIISFSSPRRHVGQTSSFHRPIAFLLLGLISIANFTSFISVVQLLIGSSHGPSGRELLASAIAIFLTNIIVFALWYWEIDSPGLSGRKWSRADQDFQFTQQDQEKNFPDWQPKFIDYIYLSLTNAINFAPADARPITAQAKVLMGIQALISVFTLALLLARSVSILGQ